MFDQRELDKGREWRFNAKDIVRSAAAAQQSEPNDEKLMTAIWQTVRPWGLSMAHAKTICDAVKAVRP